MLRNCGLVKGATLEEKLYDTSLLATWCELIDRVLCNRSIAPLTRPLRVNRAESLTTCVLVISRAHFTVHHSSSQGWSRPASEKRGSRSGPEAIPAVRRLAFWSDGGRLRGVAIFRRGLRLGCSCRCFLVLGGRLRGCCRSLFLVLWRGRWRRLLVLFWLLFLFDLLVTRAVAGERRAGPGTAVGASEQGSRTGPGYRPFRCRRCRRRRRRARTPRPRRLSTEATATTEALLAIACRCSSGGCWLGVRWGRRALLFLGLFLLLVPRVDWRRTPAELEPARW